ncbi:MAG: nodulation protein NfeD [Thermoanaerobaculia bacterium]
MPELSDRFRIHARGAHRTGTPWIALSLLLLAVASASAETGAPAPAAAGESPVVFHLRVHSIVHPVTGQYLVEGIAEAARADAAAIVIELDTPGGLLSTTREISTAILGAEPPVVVWVAPAGGQAASAGFFLLMAGDFAAMAPGTNTGAAHPVGGQGETIDGVMGKKVEEDAAATIRSLAARHGRDVHLAESAVVESRSWSDSEALAAGLVDVIASDLPELLTALEGREYRRGNQVRQLALGGAYVRELPLSPFQRFLSAIAHPNIAYLLMSLGFIGIYFELAHPGAVLPGVVGAIALLLGLFALSVLPVNYAGVGLILLAIVFFIAEIKVTSFGLLAVGGIISLVLGSSMLFRSVDPALRISRGLIAATAVVVALLALFLTTLATRARRAPVQTGREAMLGARATVRTALDPEGRVFLLGEWWNARAEEPIESGAEVEVTAVDGMMLTVRRVQG